MLSVGLIQREKVFERAGIFTGTPGSAILLQRIPDMNSAFPFANRSIALALKSLWRNLRED